MRFTVNGQVLDLTREEIVARIRGLDPDPIRLHAVNIEGVWYPVKQVFAQVSGLDVADFNTNHARSILKRLGFRVKRFKR